MNHSKPKIPKPVMPVLEFDSQKPDLPMPEPRPNVVLVGDEYIRGTLKSPEYRWPKMLRAEELLRIVLLQLLISGKDLTVQPWKLMSQELEWRRTDSRMSIAEQKFSVEYIAQSRARLSAVNSMFLEQFERELAELNRACNHKYEDGTDATRPVPVSGDRWCRTCGAEF